MGICQVLNSPADIEVESDGNKTGADIYQYTVIALLLNYMCNIKFALNDNVKCELLGEI